MTVHLNLKNIAIGVAVLVVLWHITTALTPNVRISGLLMAKPANPGYAWSGTGNADSRFFWQQSDVRWQPGLQHPDYQCKAGDRETLWNPRPGYAFINESQGLITFWKAGLKHPDYMALSDGAEGKWVPITGYRLIYKGDTFVDAIWEPNKRYDAVKVMSLTEKDRYKPFPGYRFIEPDQSLKVVWIPGTVNYENPRLVAGASEGAWIINSSQSAPRVQYVQRKRGIQGRDVGLFMGGMATGVILDRVVR